MIQLRKNVEAAKSMKRSAKQQQCFHPNAATHSLEFLLSTLSEVDNSYHLRRAALTLCREILERSSDARAYLNSGEVLMDFVSVIRKVNGECDEEGSIDSTSISPRRMFQLDAIELIHCLSDKFSSYYPKFIVASRLLSEISVASFAPMRDQRGQQDMKSLRIERDIALQRGDKACDVLQRMIERADTYFKILVPRFGGFLYTEDSDEPQQFNSNDEIENAAECDYANEGTNSIHRNNDEGIEGECNDDDLIDWEEGDAADEHNEIPSSRETKLVAPHSEGEVRNDHHAAVSQTLDVMERSGVLQEGGLSVELGSLVQNSTVGEDTNNNVHQKLQKLVKDFSSRRLPLFSRWIHALSHADGMEVRSVEDPANTGGGPVSLVLLSEEKRAARRALLKRMLTVKSEIEAVIQAASALGNMEEEKTQQSNSNDACVDINVSKHTSLTAGKTTWLSSVVVAGKPAAKKKTKKSKFRVVYRKK